MIPLLESINAFIAIQARLHQPIGLHPVKNVLQVHIIHIMQLQPVLIVILEHIKVHGQLQMVVSAFLALVVHMAIMKVALTVLYAELAVMLYLIIHFKHTQVVQTVQVVLIL
jgi:hypothetical protein